MATYLGSNRTTVAQKTTTITVYKRKTFKILYTKVNYSGDLPSGDFSDAYFVLKGVYPIQFAPKQWVSDTTPLTYSGIRSTVGCGNSVRALNLLRKLSSRRAAYNRTQPPEAKVDFIVGILPSSRLEDGVDGCSNKTVFPSSAFVTDKGEALRVAVAHEIGHLNDLPIPGRGGEEYPGGPDGLGYPIDDGFKVPTERKHFFNFLDSLNRVTKQHKLFTNFMGLASEQTTWVDELTYDFLFNRLQP